MTAAAAMERDLALPDGRGVQIRRAVPDDAARYSHISAGSAAKRRTSRSAPKARAYRGRGARLSGAGRRTRTTRSPSWPLVDGEMVGGLTFDGGRRPRLRHAGEFGISVAQAYAGLGIGRAMIEYMIAWAEASGVVRKINLKVRVDNAAAIRLYERMGWVHEGRTTRDTIIDGRFNDCLLMGRAVDPP